MKNENKTTKNISFAWAMLCQSSSVDANNNNLSLFNLIEEITVGITPDPTQKLPEIVNVPFPFHLVTLWKRNIENLNPTADVEVKLFDPKNKELQKIEYKLVFPDGKKNLRSIIQSPVFSVTDTGGYVFKISMKESGESAFTEVAEVPVNVVLKK